jgi:SET domain-containing protein
MPKKERAKFVIKRSSAGLGLFARVPFKKDDFVIEYTGEIIPNSIADERGNRYIFEISSRRSIDGSTRKNLARYLNHSCDPNCEAEIDGTHVMIYAIKNIKPGEELTYDYGKEYFEDFIKSAGCRCGAKQHAM